MEFVEQLTLFADAKRRPENYGPLMGKLPKDRNHALLMFYFELLHHYTKKADAENGIRESLAASLMELLWFGSKQRYYKLYPRYLEMFLKTRLDLPATVLQSPTSTFTILLPKGQQQLTYRTRQATSIMLTITRRGVLEKIVNDYAIHPEGASPEELVRRVMEAEQEAATRPEPAQRTAMMAVWATGEHGDQDLLTSVKLYYRMVLDENALLQDLLQSWETLHPEALIRGDDEEMQKFLNQCFRVALSVSFLATAEDRALDPDVLSADMPRYIAAVNAGDDAAITKLHTRATSRRGAEGYVLGREDLLGRRRHPREAREEAELTGRELQFQHLRDAHFHLFWTGEGRKTPRVRFLRPTFVRDDLPLPPVPTIAGAATPHE